MKCLILAAALCCLVGQSQAIEKYNEIRDKLTQGHELSLTVDTTLCRSNTGGGLVISMPMRQWQIIGNGAGREEIRSDDFYFTTASPGEITRVYRTASIYSDGAVEVTLTVNDDVATQSWISCYLGKEAANVHENIKGSDPNHIKNYNELRAALLTGDQMEAIAYLHDCQGSEVLPVDTLTLAYEILRFEINGDGTANEHIYFDEHGLLSNDGATDFFIGAQSVTVDTDGSAHVVLVEMNTNFQELNRRSVTCNIGTSLKFTRYDIKEQETFREYNRIREAVLNGHDMEMISWVSRCNSIEGDVPEQGKIISARFEEFNFYKAGGTWGPREHIVFSQYGVSVDGLVYNEVATVYDDSTVILEYTGSNRNGVVAYHSTLSCQLGEAILFNGIKKMREPVKNFHEIHQGVLDRSQIYEIEIDFDTCGSPGNGEHTIFGGIAWQSYTDPSKEGDFFYADFTALKIEHPAAGSNSLAWDTVGIFVTSDNVVAVTRNVYDFVTGGSVMPGGDETFFCELTQGVEFYKYPA